MGLMTNQVMVASDSHRTQNLLYRQAGKMQHPAYIFVCNIHHPGKNASQRVRLRYLRRSAAAARTLELSWPVPADAVDMARAQCSASLASALGRGAKSTGGRRSGSRSATAACNSADLCIKCQSSALSPLTVYNCKTKSAGAPWLSTIYAGLYHSIWWTEVQAALRKL